MGRAARANKRREISIDRGDLFELIAKHQAHELRIREANDRAAKIAAEMVQKDILASGREGKAFVDQLARKYKFDPNAAITWDEKRLKLIVKGETSASK